MDFLMFLLGLCPILWMIIALCGFKMAGYKASFVGDDRSRHTGNGSMETAGARYGNGSAGRLCDGIVADHPRNYRCSIHI